MTTTVTALDLKFDEAIAYLRQKTNTTSEHWTDVYAEANTRAFTVAGAGTDALVGDFRKAVTKALETGTALRDFRDDFDTIVDKHGWIHNGTPGWRSRIIFETNLSTAYSAGRYAQQTEPETLAAFPYWEYVHSGAAHPRKAHLALNGKIYRADDPWWDTYYPPNGWGCGCRVRPVSARGLARMGITGPVLPAPTIETRQWVNPHTGEIKYVPVGIDPGFEHNPGRVWKAEAVKLPANATLQPGTPIDPAALPRRPAPAATPTSPAPTPDDELPLVIPAERGVPGSPIPPRHFPSLAEADETLASEAADWAASLSREERYAIAEYRGASGFLLNEQLRAGAVSERLRPLVDALRSAIGRSRLAAPVRVWRGVGVNSPFGRARAGDIVPDAGFTSASVDEAMAMEIGELVIELDLPAGTPAAYINRVPRLSAEPEYEMLLAPGRRVRVIERTGNRIKAELIDE